jgi:hypothetical protein
MTSRTDSIDATVVDLALRYAVPRVLINALRAEVSRLAAPAGDSGWRLVPEKPDAAMLQRAQKLWNYSQSWETACDCYRAMLAAAPSAPAGGELATGARSDKDFYSGVMVALDVIYTHDDATSVLAVELVSTMNTVDLLDAAKADGYHNLPNLRKTCFAAHRSRAALAAKG